MKYKLVGITVFILMTTMIVSAMNVTVDHVHPGSFEDVLPNIPGLNWGVDQKQTWCDGYGIVLEPPIFFAQRFTPTKDQLTAVSLFVFKYGDPPEHVVITVTIKDSLNGSDLATITRDTTVHPIGSVALWTLFDFEDISLIPGNPYFIVVSANASIVNNTYCWAFSSAGDRYTQGEAWMKENQTANWTIDIFGSGIQDFCFKTYYKKPLDIALPINNDAIANFRLFSILDRFPNAFPILRYLLGF